MKKVLLLIMTFVAVLSFTACKAEDNKEQDTTGNLEENLGNDQEDEQEAGLEGSLEELLEKIYDTADLDDNFRDYVKNGTMNEEVTAERAEYFLGKADIEFETALASEPMIQPGAYSLVLVRVQEGADIEQIKKDIKENVNPNKWICVGVAEENIIVDSIGDIVFLVMSDDHATSLHEAFLALER